MKTLVTVGNKEFLMNGKQFADLCDLLAKSQPITSEYKKHPETGKYYNEYRFDFSTDANLGFSINTRILSDDTVRAIEAMSHLSQSQSE